MHETLFVISTSPDLQDPIQFIVLSVFPIMFALWGPGRRQRASRVVGWLVGIGFLVFGVFYAIEKQRRHDELYRAYAEGRYVVADGLVHLEHLEPAEGHDLGDIVHVGKQSFQIRTPDWAGNYNQTVAHGGVLREGASVRVWLYNGNVLRIDRVPKPGASTDAAPDASGSAKPSPEEKRATQVDAG